MNATPKAQQTQLDQDILAIQKLPDCVDDRQEMIVLLLAGKNLHQAIRHTRAQAARDRRWGGVTQPEFSTKEKLSGKKTLCPDFARLDEEIGESGRTLHDVISDSQADESNQDLVKTRTAVLGEKLEGLLDIVAQGTDSLAEFCGISRRMAQLEINRAVDEIEKIDSQESLLSREERVEAVLEGLVRRREGVSKAGRKAGLVRAEVREQAELFGEVI